MLALITVLHLGASPNNQPAVIEARQPAIEISERTSPRHDSHAIHQMNDNPYTPPSTDARLPRTESPVTALNRPASSKWAVAWLSLHSVATFVGTVERVQRIVGHGLLGSEALAIASYATVSLGSLVAFLSLIFGKRKPWCYYLVSIYLGIITILKCWLMYQYTLGTSLDAIMHRNQSTPAKIGAWTAIITIVVVCARFVFGGPSRLYYGVAQPKQS